MIALERDCGAGATLGATGGGVGIEGCCSDEGCGGGVAGGGSVGGAGGGAGGGGTMASCVAKLSWEAPQARQKRAVAESAPPQEPQYAVASSTMVTNPIREARRRSRRVPAEPR